MAIQGTTGFAQDTTLNTALSATALTAYLVDKVNWPTGSNDRFIIQIGSEYLLISLRVGNTLTIATRGYNGTTAAVHAAGVTATVLGYETIRTAFDAPGFLATLSPATGATGLATFENTPSSANFAALITDESGTGAVILSNSPTITTPSLTGTATVTASGAANVPLVVKGAAAQSADLQQWQNSTGSIIASLGINSLAGGAGVNIGADFFTSRSNGSGTYFAVDGVSATAIQRTAGSPAFIVKGAAAQTADLQQWQNSAGTVLSKIANDGTSTLGPVNIVGNLSVTAASGFGGITAFTGSSIVGISTNLSTGVGILVRSVAAQTADFLQLQDSTGAVLVSVGANGTIATGKTTGAPTLASAATITPVTPIAFVSGVVTINTITAPAPISTNGGAITIIPTGIFLTSVAGNISIASTTVVGKALIMTYDPITLKWYPSY